MKKVILQLIIVILTSIGCSSRIEDKTTPSETTNILPSNYLNQEKDPYDINFDLDAEASKIIIEINPNSYSYYLSPSTPGDFKGLLRIIIPENEFISINGPISNSPEAVEEENPWGNQRMHVIRQKTTHTQHYELTTEADFSVQGIVQFVIEPKCTLEKIPVTFFRKNGKLSFVRNCP